MSNPLTIVATKINKNIDTWQHKETAFKTIYKNKHRKLNFSKITQVSPLLSFFYNKCTFP